MAERHVTDGDTIVELWIAGPLTTARALGSALINNNNRKTESGIFMGDDQIHLNLATHYSLEVQRNRVTKIGIATRCRLIHNQATKKADPSEGLYIVTPESVREAEHAPESFFGRLFGAQKMPFMPEWADWMWREGFTIPTNHRGRDIWPIPLIREIEGDGLFAYRINTNAQRWLTIVRRHLDLVHHIVYNPSYIHRYRPTLAEERKAYATHDPRFPKWRNILDDGKVSWVHDENGETVERGVYQRYTEFPFMIQAAALEAGIEAVIDQERN